jgi:hypothetical protein
MSFAAHLAVLGVLIIDLALAAPMIGDVAGSWAILAVEFFLILGYVLCVLQWQPWRRPRGEGDGTP